jgi:hypothetical protein
MLYIFGFVGNVVVCGVSFEHMILSACTYMLVDLN